MEAGKKLKSEIERRTRDTSKLIEIEAQKLAVGEMVLERLDIILELLHTAGFKVVKTTVAAPPASASTSPPGTVIMQASQLQAGTAVPVKNPCSMCGQEAAFDENMPDGTKKFYCRPHGQHRMREKQEEEATKALMGNEGTMFARPKNPNQPPAQKIVIQADAADPLKGPFPNGGAPPPNHVLDE